MATIKSKAALQAVKTSTHKINNADWQDFVESAVLKLSSTGYANPAMLGSGTASSVTYLRGDGVWAEVEAGTTLDVSAFIETLLDDPDAATARATLGLGTISTLDSSLFVVKTSTVADGASAVAHVLDTSTAYTTPGAKLLSLRNATVEKFSVGYDGALSIPVGAPYQMGGNNVLIYSGGVVRLSDLGGGLAFRVGSIDSLALNPLGAVTLTQTWNNALTTFKAFTIDVTDTASAAASLLADYQVGGVSKFKVDKYGQITVAGAALISAYGTGADFSGGWGYTVAGSSGFVVGQQAYLYFSGSTAGNSLSDVIFRRAAAVSAPLGVLDYCAYRIVGVNESGVKFRIHNATPNVAYGFPSEINHEALEIGWTSNVAHINVIYAGDGVARSLAINGDGGNVGIGTTSPQELLDFGTSGGIAVRGSATNSVGAGNTGGLFISYNQNPVYGARIEAVHTGSVGKPLTLAGYPIRFASSHSGLEFAHMDDGGYWTLEPVFNNGGTTFTAFKVNVTDTASASASLLMDLQVGGTSKFSVSKNGSVNVLNGSYSAPSITFGGASTFGFYGLSHGVGLTTSGVSDGLQFDGTDGGVMVRAASEIIMTFGNTSHIGGPAHYGITMWQAGDIRWTSGFALATYDVALKRVSAGVLGVYQGDGTTGGTFKTSVLLMGANLGCWDTTTGNLQLHRDATGIGWSDGDASPGNAGWSLVLYKDAANVLAQRNGANAQTYRLYNDFTDTGNYSRLELRWTGNYAYVMTHAAGTGVASGLVIGTATSNSTYFQTGGTTRWEITSGGHLTCGTANAYDIGVDFNTCPRKVYAYDTIWAKVNLIASNGVWAERSGAYAGFNNPGVDGLFVFSGSDGSNFARLCLGGLAGAVTASKPAIGTAGTTVRFILGDDSGYAPIKAYSIEAVGGTVTASAPVLNLTQTWNSGGVTFTGILANFTDTASASGSLLIDLQIGGASKFSVSKAGIVLASGQIWSSDAFVAHGGNSVYGTRSGFADVYSSAGASLSYWNGSAVVPGLTMNAGTVGVGTTTPDFNLHVAGISATIGVGGEGNGYALLTAGDGSTAGYLAIHTPGGIRLGYIGYNPGLFQFACDVGQFYFGGGTRTASNPLLFSQTWNNALVAFSAFTVDITDTASASNSLLMDLQVGGTTKFSVGKASIVHRVPLVDSSGVGIIFPYGEGISNAVFGSSGTSTWFRTGNGYLYFCSNGATLAQMRSDFGLRLASSYSLGWSATADTDIAADVILARDAAGVLALKNGTNAQEFRVYKTYTDASNYERLTTKMSGSYGYVWTEQAGTGVARGLVVGTTGDAGVFLMVNGGTVAQLDGTGFHPGAGSGSGSFALGYDNLRWKRAYLGGSEIAASTPVIDITQTWNNGAVNFVGILADFTSTASGSGSLLMDLRVGGSPVFSVTSTHVIIPSASSAAPGLRFSSGLVYSGIFYATGDGQAGFGISTNTVANAVFSGATPGGLRMGSGRLIGWDSTTGANGGTFDTALGRNAAGVVEVNNGTAGTLRDLIARNVQATTIHNGAGAIDLGAISSFILRVAGNGFYPLTDNSVDLGYAGGSFSWKSVNVNAYVKVFGTTVTASTPVLNLTQTWNNGAVNFIGILADFTSTASGAGSMLLDLQVGSASKFSVRKDGMVRIGGTSSSYSGLKYESDAYVGPTMRFRLADDSADVDVLGKRFFSTNGGVEANPGFCIGGPQSGTGLYAAYSSVDLALGGYQVFNLYSGGGYRWMKILQSCYITWSQYDTTCTNGASQLYLNQVAADILGIGTNPGATPAGAAIEMMEMTAPSAPGANKVRLYAEDNGAGKTRLMALFPSGVAQQVAIEP